MRWSLGNDSVMYHVTAKAYKHTFTERIHTMINDCTATSDQEERSCGLVFGRVDGCWYKAGCIFFYSHTQLKIDDSWCGGRCSSLCSRQTVVEPQLLLTQMQTQIYNDRQVGTVSSQSPSSSDEGFVPLKEDGMAIDELSEPGKGVLSEEGRYRGEHAWRARGIPQRKQQVMTSSMRRGRSLSACSLTSALSAAKIHSTTLKYRRRRRKWRW